MNKNKSLNDSMYDNVSMCVRFPLALNGSQTFRLKIESWLQFFFETLFVFSISFVTVSGDRFIDAIQRDLRCFIL